MLKSTGYGPEDKRFRTKSYSKFGHDSAPDLCLIVKQALNEEERQCHQIFRLGKHGKNESYEWYKDRVEDRVEGTCQWFLSQAKYRSWLDQKCGILMVSADPGCGKSVLARHLVDQGLPRDKTICYFFFKDQL